MENLALQPQELETHEEDLLTSLLDFIDKQEVEELGISAEDSFLVTSRGQADYLIRQYSKLQAEVAEIEETAKQEAERYLSKIEAWRQAEVRKRQSPMDWIASRLRAYAEQELADSKKRSLSLPNGSLKFSKRQSSYDYDEDVLKAFLEQSAPEFLKEQPKKIDKAGLKKAGEEKGGVILYNGHPVPGVKIERLPDNFKIG